MSDYERAWGLVPERPKTQTVAAVEFAEAAMQCECEWPVTMGWNEREQSWGNYGGRAMANLWVPAGDCPYYCQSCGTQLRSDGTCLTREEQAREWALANGWCLPEWNEVARVMIGGEERVSIQVAVRSRDIDDERGDGA